MAKDTIDTTTATVLELLIDKINSLQTNGGSSISADQLERLIEKAGASADALREKLIPENKISPGISVYAPFGEAKKVPLRRETHFCGHTQRSDNLTPEEVAAFDAITRDCEARNGSWRARVVKKGLREALFVECDEMVDRDRARDLPPLVNLLTELNEGPVSVDLVALRKQVDELRAQLAAVNAA